MENITFQPHILIDNDKKLFQDFMDAIEKIIENNKFFFMSPALNYINDKKRKISLQKIINTKGPSLTHFCSEGMCNYYHYINSNDNVYLIKEYISHTDLYDRLFCFLEI